MASLRSTIRLNGIAGHARLMTRGLLLAFVLVGVLALDARPAAAHAFLRESDPAANAILPTAPTLVRLRFTERLERDYSRAELYDQTGNAISTLPVRAGDDAYTMLLDLPAGLPTGTYSILWRTLSLDDGHTAQNYFAFTIGSQEDVQTIVAPAAASVATGPPEWMRTTSRWAALLGLAATIAVWPTWLFVLRPAISPAWQAGPALTRRVRRLATGALVAAVLGSLYALLVQADSVGGADGLLTGIRTTLNDTRYGQLWLIRIGLFLVYAAVLTSSAWWWPWKQPVTTVMALGLAAALPLPFSLIAHASAQTEGRDTAIAADVLHLLGASLWVGGLFVLLGGLIPSLPHLTPAGRRAVLARALPRFSALALASWGVLGITGLYAAWLQVGNLDALRETVYGRSLTLKLALLVPLLLLGAFNLLIVTRRLRRGEPGARATNRWSRRFAATVAIESMLVVLVLLVVGRLIGQPPAREALAEQAQSVTIPLEANGETGSLSLTPGAVGPNRYRLELGSDHSQHTFSPGGAEALLRVQLPSHDTGVKEIDLTALPGGAYEAQGSELSIEGDWEIEVIVRQPGTNDWVATATRSIDAGPPPVELPGEPWRFDASGIAGLLLLVVGIVGAVLAWQAGRSRLRKESAGLGAVALALGVLLLLQARETDASSNPVSSAPPDAAAVERGAALFAANCVACHGEGARGNGPAAATLPIPPADLTSPGSAAHTDQDLAGWITNGIPASGMPAFGERLGEEGVADALAYVRSLQADATVAWNAANPAECNTEPRPVESLLAMADPALATPAATPAAGTFAAPGNATPLATPVPPDPATGQPADAATVAGVTATVRELAACRNARDVLRQLALYTDANLRPVFARTPAGFAERVTAPPLPGPPTEWVAIVAVDDVRMHPDGRVSARVVASTPGGHSHAHGPAPAAATPTPLPTRTSADQINTFVLAQVGDRWLVEVVVV